MYPIEQDVLALFLEEYRQVADMRVDTVNDSFPLSGRDLLQNGLTVDRYSVSGEKLELGSCIASELTLRLDNRDGRFSGTRFEGAEIYLRIGVKKWDADRWEKAEVRYVPVGYFTVDAAPEGRETLTLSALDRMARFDKDFDASGISFPCTAGELLSHCCQKCGVPLHTDPLTLKNASYRIESAPNIRALTYRQVLSWLGQIFGKFAYIDWEGKLRMEWYGKTPALTIDQSLRYPTPKCEKPVTLTGVLIETDEGETTLAGTDAYAVEIVGNALITHDHRVLAESLLEDVEGFTYLPFSCTARPLVHLYPGDAVRYTDYNGVEHPSLITHWNFKLNGKVKLSAKGTNAVRESYSKANPLTQRQAHLLQEMKKAQERELSQRESALLQLNETVVNSFGLYRTVTDGENGGKLYYYHSAASLEESSVIYTFREGGFAWTDKWQGENTVWQYGVTKDGNAILNVLSVYQLTAKQIAADALKSAHYLSPAEGDKFAQSGSFFNLRDGSFITKNFTVDGEGNGFLRGGDIGGWLIKPERLIRTDSAGQSGILSVEHSEWFGIQPEEYAQSLVKPTVTSGGATLNNYIPIRFFAGASEKNDAGELKPNSAPFMILNDGSMYVPAISSPTGHLLIGADDLIGEMKGNWSIGTEGSTGVFRGNIRMGSNSTGNACYLDGNWYFGFDSTEKTFKQRIEALEAAVRALGGTL